jgi:putative PIN family toxin of toxin-antitoxin system
VTRVVFDSTVLISAFLRPGGLSDELLGLTSTEQLQLILAREIIEEVRQKLVGSRRIRARYVYDDRDVALFCEQLQVLADIPSNLPPLAGIVRDPADDVILACAVAGNAEAVVTRDKDLLSLGSHRSIAIMAPEELRQRLRSRLR